MENIYDKAHELARLLKQHEDVAAYREAAAKIEADPVKKKMITDFRKAQIDAYNAKVTKGEIPEDLKKNFENLIGIIQLNPEVSDFLMKEEKFSVMFDEIMKIINEALEIEVPGAN